MMSELKIVENAVAKLTVEDGVFICTYKAGEVNLEQARQVVKDRLALCEYQACPGIIVDRGVTKISKEAREYFGSDDGIEGVTAAAVVTNKPVGNMIINFLVRIQKPAIPVKTFTNMDSAKMWLKQYV